MTRQLKKFGFARILALLKLHSLCFNLSFPHIYVKSAISTASSLKLHTEIALYKRMIVLLETFRVDKLLKNKQYQISYWIWVNDNFFMEKSWSPKNLSVDPRLETTGLALKRYQLKKFVFEYVISKFSTAQEYPHSRHILAHTVSYKTRTLSSAVQEQSWVELVKLL